MISKHSDDRLVRLSGNVREALIFAEAERNIARHDCLTTGHLLMGFFHLDTESKNKFISRGVTLQKVRVQVNKAIQQGKLERCRKGWSDKLMNIFENFADESVVMDMDTILIELLHLPDSIAQRVLKELGITSDQFQS